MKFTIKRASDWRREKPPVKEAVLIAERHWEIEINSLEELIALSDREDDPLIIEKESIIIYDDYVE